MSAYRSIVLIDDDMDDHEIFRIACAQIDSNIEVVSCENGEQALDMLNTKPITPDFIFLDLNMPRLNGIEVLEEIKKNELLSTIPVIVYTTSFDAKVKRKCTALGAFDVMEKPNSFDVLCHKLENVLHSLA
jgi:CheY-like chemotaxis protein